MTDALLFCFKFHFTAILEKKHEYKIACLALNPVHRMDM